MSDGGISLGYAVAVRVFGAGKDVGLAMLKHLG